MYIDVHSPSPNVSQFSSYLFLCCILRCCIGNKTNPIKEMHTKLGWYKTRHNKSKTRLERPTDTYRYRWIESSVSQGVRERVTYRDATHLKRNPIAIQPFGFDLIFHSFANRHPLIQNTIRLFWLWPILWFSEGIPLLWMLIRFEYTIFFKIHLCP